MRLAAHLCGDRPHRHHRARTKLVNLLTARTLLHGGLFCFVVCMHRACTCRANSSLVYGCAMVKENTMFLAALIIWSRLKSPTTAMLVGIGGRNGPPELLYPCLLRHFYSLLYIFSSISRNIFFLEYLLRLEIFLKIKFSRGFYLFLSFFRQN